MTSDEINEFFPKRIRPEDWQDIVLGINEHGEAVGVNLTRTAHTLMAGVTGSGKSIALHTYAVSALTRGHVIVLIDPVKSGADYAKLAPWCTAVARDALEASEVLVRLYAELTRRKNILIREGKGTWTDLSTSLRNKELIAPLTVIVDEFAGFALLEVGKCFSSTPDGEAEARTARAWANASYLVGRLAREGRAFGIHLVIGTQRPGASIMSAELNSNLSGRVLLTRGTPSEAWSIPMMFPRDDAVPRILSDLSPTTRGQALIGGDGESTSIIRVEFLRSDEVAQTLERAGVPKPMQWKLRE